MLPESIDALETKLIELSAADPGRAPHIGRMKDGWMVGMEALASPICAQAITPDLRTISGLEPKFSGFQRTRSASVPTAT